jgi:hypothetical protein
LTQYFGRGLDPVLPFLPCGLSIQFHTVYKILGLEMSLSRNPGVFAFFWFCRVLIFCSLIFLCFSDMAILNPEDGDDASLRNVTTYGNTWRRNPGDHNRYLHRSENLKSRYNRQWLSPSQTFHMFM